MHGMPVRLLLPTLPLHSYPMALRHLTDRTGERFLHLCVPWWGVMVGYIIGVSTFSIPGRYIAMFLMASGYAGTSLSPAPTGPTRPTDVTNDRPLGFALTLVWVANAVPRPPAKRAAAMGIVNGFGNLGNLYVALAPPQARPKVPPRER